MMKKNDKLLAKQIKNEKRQDKFKITVLKEERSQHTLKDVK